MSIRCWQKCYESPAEWPGLVTDVPFTPQLTFLFSSREILEQISPSLAKLPMSADSIIVGCSTAGEIACTRLLTDSIVVTSLAFDHTHVRTTVQPIPSVDHSAQVGRKITEALLGQDLRHIMVLSEGLHINGSQLVAGLRDCIPEGVSLSGGLAGDADRFTTTKILCGDQELERAALGIGFYSKKLLVGCGSLGGWDPFGPERLITRATANKLFELDGKPALDLYREYLGPMAKDLPASGLLFPLCVTIPGNAEPLVRTLLSIDENEHSLTFAGDLPEGCTAQMMRANTDRLLDGAASAAGMATVNLGGGAAQFALLVSCVGRRLVLRQRAEDELEAAHDALGPTTCMAGFYSYGEISPFITHARCELHNQTMTVTTFREED